MTTIRLRFWAGARAAARVESEQWSADSVGEALELARRSRGDGGFDRVLGMCSILIDGVVAGPADLAAFRADPVDAEVLPPFAGG